MSKKESLARLAVERELSQEELERLEHLLGKEPDAQEMAVATALWSEHASYKSSKVYLKELPSRGQHVIQGPGENAGIVDLGYGWVAVFKMECRSHRTALNPEHGAATAVGGILRDVFTMGARPIACLGSLRAAPPQNRDNRRSFVAALRGFSDYANAVGVPTVTMEAGFHASYAKNMLVNAFAVGVARRERVLRSRASGPGNPILYVGRDTAAHGLDRPDKKGKKTKVIPAGDPFTEKVLLEACLQALRTGAIVALQDLGTGGLGSTCYEMASRGGTGFAVDLDAVPLEDDNLSPLDIILSETQERMLMVARRGSEGDLERVFHRWGLDITPVGEVTSDGRGIFRAGRKETVDLPVRRMMDRAPLYRQPADPPRSLTSRQKAPEVPEPQDPGQALKDLLDTPELGGRQWVWGHLDHTVRASTARGPCHDASVLQVKGTPMGLALSSDVNPAYCDLDPRRGAMQAVAQGVRSLACVGAEPLGLSDSLAFGDPEDPMVMWQFQEAIRGIAEACRLLEVPVVSGAVSLYNHSGSGPIQPTPTVATVGSIPDLGQLPVSSFVKAKQRIIILGPEGQDFGGSAYLRLLHGVEQGLPPAVDLALEMRLAELLRLLVYEGWVKTAHLVSSGGLGVALAEAGLSGGIGVRVKLDCEPLDLFSESQGRVILAVDPKLADDVLAEAEAADVPARDVGEVGGQKLDVKMAGGKIALGVEELHQVWSTALPRALAL